MNSFICILTYSLLIFIFFLLQNLKIDRDTTGADLGGGSRGSGPPPLAWLFLPFYFFVNL